MTTTHIFTFTATDERLNSVTQNDSATQQILVGTAVEKPQLRHWVFESSDEAQSKETEDKLAKILGDDHQHHVVSFRTSAKACFMAPVTEFVTATVKPGTEDTDFEKVADITLRATEEGGALGWAWGYDGKERNAVLLIGWKSVEDHVSFTKTELFKNTSVPFQKAVATASVIHIAYQNM